MLFAAQGSYGWSFTGLPSSPLNWSTIAVDYSGNVIVYYAYVDAATGVTVSEVTVISDRMKVQQSTNFAVCTKQGEISVPQVSNANGDGKQISHRR